MVKVMNPQNNCKICKKKQCVPPTPDAALLRMHHSIKSYLIQERDNYVKLRRFFVMLRSDKVVS